MEIRATMCCGVAEFSGLSYNSPEQILHYIGRERRRTDNRVPFIIFTNVDGYDGGANLDEYIGENKLGTVVTTRYRRNPNSGNRIKVMVWQINRRGFRRWYNKHYPPNNNQENAEQEQQ